MSHTDHVISELQSMSLDEIAADKNTKAPYIGSILPAEIRLQIWSYLCVDWYSKIPNVIKALRPDRTLYHEALSIFYRENTYIFHCHNDWSFGDMTSHAVQTITRAEIHIEQKIMTTGLWTLGHPAPSEDGSGSHSSATLSDATSLHCLTLRFRPDDTSEDCPPFIRVSRISYSPNYFLVTFPNLIRVELGWDLSGPRSQQTTDQMRERIGDGIKLVNSRMGIEAKLMRVVGMYDYDEVRRNDLKLYFLWTQDTWFWVAREGEFLGRRKKSEDR